MKKLLIAIIISLGAVSCEIQKANPDDSTNSGTVSGAVSKTEAAEMKKLYGEILTLSQSVTCTNPADWKIIGIGSKACGGPTSYIAYSKKIDEKNFLAKVNLYNQKSDFLNKKYHLISDCMMLMPPSAVSCVNGKAVLKNDTNSTAY